MYVESAESTRILLRNSSCPALAKTLLRTQECFPSAENSMCSHVVKTLMSHSRSRILNGNRMRWVELSMSTALSG
ncbi:hypothetical protein AOLI_G00187690 [Acnodon oligacanthus]